MFIVKKRAYLIALMAIFQHDLIWADTSDATQPVHDEVGNQTNTPKKKKKSKKKKNVVQEANVIDEQVENIEPAPVKPIKKEKKKKTTSKKNKSKKEESGRFIKQEVNQLDEEKNATGVLPSKVRDILNKVSGENKEEFSQFTKKFNTIVQKKEGQTIGDYAGLMVDLYQMMSEEEFRVVIHELSKQEEYKNIFPAILTELDKIPGLEGVKAKTVKRSMQIALKEAG